MSSDTPAGPWLFAGLLLTRFLPVLPARSWGCIISHGQVGLNSPSDATRQRLKEDTGEEQKAWGMGSLTLSVEGIGNQRQPVMATSTGHSVPHPLKKSHASGTFSWQSDAHWEIKSSRPAWAT